MYPSELSIRLRLYEMESGIDLGFDLTALSAEQLDLDYSDLEEVIGTLKNQEYYELKSKTVPETERCV